MELLVVGLNIRVWLSHGHRLRAEDQIMGIGNYSVFKYFLSSIKRSMEYVEIAAPRERQIKFFCCNRRSARRLRSGRASALVGCLRTSRIDAANRIENVSPTPPPGEPERRRPCLELGWRTAERMATVPMRRRKRSLARSRPC